MEKKDFFTIAGFVLVYTGFVFGGFNTLLNAKTKPIESSIQNLNSEVKGIKTEIKDIKTEMRDIQIKLAQLLSNNKVVADVSVKKVRKK